MEDGSIVFDQMALSPERNNYKYSEERGFFQYAGRGKILGKERCSICKKAREELAKDYQRTPWSKIFNIEPPLDPVLYAELMSEMKSE